MGGEVKTALNIVCFPEKMDLNILGEIMRGGSEKVIEAGGTLAGGHSIQDATVKYGLSVMGTVHPKKIWSNNSGRPGDQLILTKKLGVGIICTAITSMTTLNKKASEICRKYAIHACTDVTGFGFLGHLHEMMDGRLRCRIYADQVPVFPEALSYADEFLLTAAGQRNRNHVEPYVEFSDISFAMEEVLFDPQTSGGLLVAVKREHAHALVHELQKAGLPAAIVGEISETGDPQKLPNKEITVTK